MRARDRVAGMVAAVSILLLPMAASAGALQVGVAERSIDPPRLPVILSGGFLARSVDEATGPLLARALVVDSGGSVAVIALVDTLMMPGEFLDEVKAEASRRTGIPPDRMLIAATHTHSAPALMGALGTDADEEYIAHVRPELVQVIVDARQRMQPAEVGWAAAQAPGLTNNRRWILRSDKVRKDPFGDPTVRANMHPGYQNPEFTGPSGPVDAELSLLAFRSPAGRPLAVMANYSMHYVGGDKGVSPDYFGPFGEHLRRLLGVSREEKNFIAMMSQGTSGDLHYMDYSRPRQTFTSDSYAQLIAAQAQQIYHRIRFTGAARVEVVETSLEFRRRAPSPERLEWARGVMADVPGGVPRTQVEVYAREQILLAREPVRRIKLQAIRIGDLGIAAWPAEVFALSGLKVKAQSPFAHTFNIELANGAEGYIPPPEQHRLGGYTTWPARTAGLEAGAEPRVVERLLALLEKLAGKPRRSLAAPRGEYARKVLETRPATYWRGEEMSEGQALDSSGHRRHAVYYGDVAFYLEGKDGQSPYYAGGHLRKVLPASLQYSIAFWFRNGLPADVRHVTGVLYSLGEDQLGIGGLAGPRGKLYFETSSQRLEGQTTLRENAWHLVVVVRGKDSLRVYLNGSDAPEIGGAVTPVRGAELRVGAGTVEGTCFEGKIDEVAFYDRLLGAAEVRRLGGAERAHGAARRRGGSGWGEAPAGLDTLVVQ